MTLSVEDFLLSIQKLILGNDLNTTYKLALVLAVTNKAGEIPFENHPDAEVFEISYRELALEFLRIYWPQAKAYPRADKSAVKDAVLRQSFGGSNALVISLIQAFQERLCPADAQWLTFLQAQRFEKDFDRLVKDCQTRVLKKNPLQYMQGYEFLFDKDDRTNRIYVRREVAVSLCRFQPIVQELIFSRWEKMLRSIRANSGVLGETPESTLRDFLFYPHRSETLAAIRDVLRESTPAQTCFYSRGRKPPDFSQADRAPHDNKRTILARIQNFRHDSLITKIICGFQYELYTTDEQRSALSRNAGCRRFVFNKALELQNERKKNGFSLLRYKELCLELVKWKKEEKTVFLKEAMSQPLQQALKDLDRAIADSFRPKSDPARKEWPKFKSKDIGDGFRIPQFKPEHIDDANGRVKLPKIGWMRYRKSRPLAFKCADRSMKSGTVRQIHIKKDCGHWFVVFTTEFDIEMPDPKALDVGIDLGVVHAVATSDGQFFDLNTGRIKELEKEIARYQRKLALNRSSRLKLAKAGRAEAFDKTKPSRKRRRLLEKLQKLHRRVRNIRRDFQMKTAHTLAQEYGCVYVEDLKTRNMTKSAKGTIDNPGKNVKQKSGLNRAILRTGFFGMRQAIEWQQYKVGGYVIAVPAAYTSCECPSCTCTDKRNRPRQAQFRCIGCGYENNADIVGAINVRRKGRTGPSAHDKKRIAREVSAGANVPFERNSGANSENQPLGVA